LLDNYYIIFCCIIFRANNDRTSKDTDDEPFSWEAREFLRKKLVGKKVFFKTDGQVSFGDKVNRYYGDIFYPTLGEKIYLSMLNYIYIIYVYLIVKEIFNVF